MNTMRDMLTLFFGVIDLEIIQIPLLVDISLFLIVAVMINAFIFIATGFKKRFNKWVWIWLTVFILAYLFKELGIIINVLEVL